MRAWYTRRDERLNPCHQPACTVVSWTSDFLSPVFPSRMWHVSRGNQCRLVLIVYSITLPCEVESCLQKVNKEGAGNGKTWEEHCAIKSTYLMNLSWTNSVGLLLHKSTDNSPCKRSYATIHHFLPISAIFFSLKFTVQRLWICSCTLLCYGDMYAVYQGNGFFLHNLCKYCHVLHQH